MEVVLEIVSSKKRVFVSDGSILSAIEAELKVIGDVALLPFRKAPSDFPGGSKELFNILQQWSDKWASFVDVDEVEEILSGDHLTIFPVTKSASCSTVSL